MKHLSGILNKLTVLAAVAVGLSSCNRGEYAVLPKTTPYHETHRSVAIKPAVAPAAATPETAAPTAAVAPAVVAQTPVAAAPVAAKAAAPAPRKLSLVQKLAVSKVAKQVSKVADQTQLKKRTETAATSKLEGKLRQGVILLIIGLLLELLGAATGIGLIYVLGAIVAIIGVILIVLYLLDEI
ncbi:hypothetical protein [Hymenobacter algoricola]|uniref:Uncharacterized protein n=1 Tax=Hymenobacter algoricola TaxID=486267 RepID=A0ABP7NMB4_9BACT